MPTSPLDLARILAQEYGHTIDPLNYILGVAVSGRLRLHALDPDSPDPGPEIATLVAPVVDPARLAAVLPADGSAHAGLVWAEELSAASGDDRYIDFLIQVADAYLDTNDDGLPAPMDPDDRVEEVFFVAALLGRAFRHTADARYAGTLTRALSRVAAQPESGLWWHGKASPFYWGRGNAFASLGFAEALIYLPVDQPGRDALVDTHRAHLQALIRHQDDSGAWHQVIDRPDSYLELTATSMIGYALAQGLRGGWLDDSFRPAVDAAWAATAARIDDRGQVQGACAGTGPMPSLGDYLNRPAVDGHDDRAGSMALWFACAYHQLTD